MESKTKKTILFLAIKVLVSSLLLVVVFNKTGLRNILLHLQATDLRFFFLAIALHTFILYIATLRWGLLLEGKHSLGKLYSLYLMGSFFNNFLPGAIGGDAVKAYYLYRGTQQAGSSMGSVFMDRYIGLFALLTMGLISGLVAFNDLKHLGMHWVIPSLFLLFIAGSLLFFRLKIGQRFSAVSDFYEYFHRAIRNKNMLLKAYGLSFVVQSLTLLMIYLIGLGIGQKLSFTALFVFVPIVILITMIPLSISGLGIRESAFVVLFGLTGVPAEESMSISFLWFLSIASASLIGLVEYIRLRTKKV